VVMVTGVADFPPQRLPIRRSRPSPNAGANNQCNTPYSMRNLYNVSQTLTITNKAVTQTPFAQYPGGSESYGQPGLDQWVNINELPKSSRNVHIIGNQNGSFVNASTGDIEAELDIQMQTGMGVGATQYFAIEEGWMYDFAITMFNYGDACPLVITMSYGWPEEQQCDSSVLGDNCKQEHIPGWRVYLLRAEAEWLKLSATGRTVVASSGDTGAPGDNNDCSKSQTFKLHPGYPATGAWLTSVGATTLKDTSGEVDAAADVDASGGAPPICSPKYQCVCSTSKVEIPCMLDNSEYTGGGGASIVIPQPTWQSAQVAAYLKSGAKLPTHGYFNSSNRMFPDISAIGESVLIMPPEKVGGTSASCPLIGALVSQLNNWRLNNNLKPIGFFNPLLYQLAEANPEMLHDITVGDNWCDESECCPGFGFQSSKGWDPVTGWGTLNFGLLMHFVQTMDYSKYSNIRLK